MANSGYLVQNEQEQSAGLGRKLELVVQTGLLLARSTSLQTWVQFATDAGLELSGAQFGVFFYTVIGESGESCLLHTFSGIEPEKLSQLPAPVGTAVFPPAFESAYIIRSADITKGPRYSHNIPLPGAPASYRTVRSYLAVPVKANSGEVLGGLIYFHEKTGVFDQEAENLVATVAAQAASAIENFHLRHELTGKIHDLHLAERDQHEASRHLAELAAIVESSDDAIISKDLNGRITSWNHAASQLFGYSAEEIVGQSILLLIPPELHSEETTIIGKIRAGQRIEHYETVRLKRNGDRMDVSLTISPLKDRTGTVIGASKILRDISSRKKIESSLIQAEKIAATGRMAATIAHEVNNPLEAVINLIFLAQTNAHNPEAVTSYLRAAESEIVRVSHIARQTLGFYRENASAVSLHLFDLVVDAIRIYQHRCEAASISIKSDLNSVRAVLVRKGEIMQVISNIIANAIYAMPTGGTLSLSVRDVDSPAGPGVMLAIEDTGIGIPAEQQPRIFEAFFTSRGTIGTGIGLFVAKQFVEGHGGQISVASSTDPASHGTRMSIFLPTENPQPAN